MKKHYRAIWISDVHLGTRGCQAQFLLDFLDKNTCDTLYLVGDIIDMWVLSKGVYWPQEHTNVVRKVLTKSKKGTRVVYVPGNHDETFRTDDEESILLGNIEIAEEVIHTTADGRQLLVIHGDQYDAVTRYAKWIAILGDYAYRFMMWVNHLFNRVRKKMGFGYWSLSAFLKHKVKEAVNFIGEYEVALAKACKDRGLDGVICGHIHHAEIRDIDGVTYHNCGDWVESCTALAEDENGQIQVIQWAKIGHDTTNNYSH